jgi:hypothetical protein
MAIPGEVIEARAGWTDGLRDRLPPGAHVVVVGARSTHCLEGRQAGLAFRDTIAVATERGFTMAALFRVPFEGTVAEQVMKTGTGALWIDGCRITTSRADAKAMERANTPGSGRLKAHEAGFHGAWSGSTAYDTTKGRWPTNLVLVHRSGCQQEGTRRVRTGTAYEPQPKRMSRAIFGETNTLGRTVTFADEDGLETVPAWACEPGCPVAALDEMSGALASRGNTAPTKRDTTTGFTRGGSGMSGKIDAGDSGGASRFYPQLVGADDLVEWLTRLIGGPSV